MRAGRARAMQQVLRECGLYAGRVDGVAGPVTLAAVDLLFARLPAPPARGRDPRPAMRLAAAEAALTAIGALQAPAERL